MDYTPAHYKSAQPGPPNTPLELKAWDGYLTAQQGLKCFKPYRMYGGDYYDVEIVPIDLGEGAFYVDVYSIEVRKQLVLRIPTNLGQAYSSKQQYLLRIMELVHQGVIPEIF